MKTKNVVVTALVGSLALVFAISGFLLFRGISQFSKEEQTLKRSVSTLHNYYGRDPFPSRENVAREQENGKVLGRWLTGLSDSLREGQIPPIQTTPAQFLRLFSKKRDQLKALAAQSHTEVVSDAFGFERYATSGTLPAPPDVSRLAQQLVIVDELCRVLFEGGATTLTRLRREEFESAGAPVADRSGRTGRTGRTRRPNRALPAAASAGSRAWKVSHDAGVLKGKALHAHLRFGLDFEVREAGLMKIMNALAAHDMFAVVTLLQIEKTADDVNPPTASEGSSTTDATRGDVGPAPRSQRLMSGQVLEQPMHVTMEIDVYRFAELTSGKGA
ncbi:MAG: hypothetical protein HN919_19060 [Verrucomicrobia bacterium]|jgi:hypothetical protein|nr:hypothetical protein [Verrucomicrobiota bacterium]MBT7068405.1 hypothetical protein [Verrucomicrobiota bacterium]MBT7698839.1 hypothetical protein [Verrucomicrobiota bacterium]